MKKISKFIMVILLCVVAFVIGFTNKTMAAVTPALGEATSFGVLSSTFSITVGTTVNGDVGYTTLSVPLLTIAGGTAFVPKPPLAGTDQGLALAALNVQACDFNFAIATDLSLLPQPLAAGVYCITAAASIGTPAGVTFGPGTYIFRISGALTTVANSVAVLGIGANACDIFWTPNATTLGADSTFKGTIIDDAGITVGDNVAWIGRALSFATTVTTDNDTITVPACGAPATFHVIKSVVNNNGGIATAPNFNLHVKRFGADIVGSPAVGAIAPGTLYTLTPGTYIVSEDANASYTQSFGGDCNVAGSITLAAGEDKICTLTNDDIAPSGGGGGLLSKDNCPNGDYSPSYYDGVCGTAPIVSSGEVQGTDGTSGTVILTTETSGMSINTQQDISNIPGFPKTGILPEENSPWNIIALVTILMVGALALFVAYKNRKI